MTVLDHAYQDGGVQTLAEEAPTLTPEELEYAKQVQTEADQAQQQLQQAQMIHAQKQAAKDGFFRWMGTKYGVKGSFVVSVDGRLEPVT